MPDQTASASVEGWDVDPASYTLMGTLMPAFTGKLADGKDFTSDALRDRWTILAVPGSAPLSADEASYVAAATSAAGQDPALDFIVLASDSDASALSLPASPAYLLIGPDLTIEAYRGALSATPQDGVKPVFRGISEIRKYTDVLVTFAVDNFVSGGVRGVVDDHLGMIPCSSSYAISRSFCSTLARVRAPFSRSYTAL
jgi:hypothetical protein